MKAKMLRMPIAILLILYSAMLRADSAFQFSESSINSDPSDWHGLDERQVFYRKLTHKQTGHSWTMKIGKGGQIYSIKIPGLGELIAPQREHHGQWMDEVYQHTLPMPPQKAKNRNNTIVDGDIHQAGYYTQSDLGRNEQLIPRSVYSPLFDYKYEPADNSVSYVTWPQHAHLPRKHAENLVFINQTIKDLGGGVVEISLEYNKWGGARHEKFSLPWSAFRTSTVPVQIISNRDGSYRMANKKVDDKRDVPLLRNADTGGWFAFVSSNSPTAQGIGIVYGKEMRELDGQKGIVVWGTYGPPKKPELGGTVAAVYRDVTLDVGETLLYRYYLVLGTLAEIQAKANRLESKVMLAKRTVAQESAERLSVCLEGGKALGNQCARNEAPLFKAYKNYVPNAQPLFLLQHARTGEHLVTSDPYEISFDPTDGTTKYVDFLGWAVPAGMAGDKCRHQSLSEGVGSMPRQPSLGKKAIELHVLRSTEAACGATGAGGRK